MKKISENIWEFDPQVYPQLLWVAVNPTDEECKLFYDATEDIDSEEDLIINIKGYGAIVYDVVNKESGKIGSIIIFRSVEYLDIGIITHESMHIVFNLCARCRITYTNYDHEPLAYYAGWVADCCEKVKKEIENGNRTM